MKALLLFTSMLLATRGDLLGQGLINFNNRVVQYVYSPVFTYATLHPGDRNLCLRTGDPIEGPIICNQYISGTGYSAQLWAGPDVNSLTPVVAPGTATAQTFTFGTDARVGLVSFASGASISEVQGVVAGDTATIQMRAWDNLGGTINTWNEALADCRVARGTSDIFTVPNLGSSSTVVPNLVALKSFALYPGSSFVPDDDPCVPEPSLFALIGLGIGALWLRRRFAKNRG